MCNFKRHLLNTELDKNMSNFEKNQVIKLKKDVFIYLSPKNRLLDFFYDKINDLFNANLLFLNPRFFSSACFQIKVNGIDGGERLNKVMSGL